MGLARLRAEQESLVWRNGGSIEDRFRPLPAD